MKEYYLQDKFAMVRSDRELHVNVQYDHEVIYVLWLAMKMPIVSNAAPVT